MSPELAEWIVARHQRTGTAVYWWRSDGSHFQTAEGPLKPVAIPAWLVADVNLGTTTSNNTIRVIEANPWMCLVASGVNRYAVETEILVAYWTPVPTETDQ